jgi:hypothetical protein
MKELQKTAILGTAEHSTMEITSHVPLIVTTYTTLYTVEA